MKKRGEISLWFLLEAVGAFLVAYTAVSISIGYSQGTAFEKLNLAREISTEINSMYAVSGDAVAVIPDLHGYSVKIEGDTVEVYEAAFDPTKAAHHFATAQSTQIKEDFREPKGMYIKKDGNRVAVFEIKNEKENAKP
ncbi:hypothetical protein J4212_01035 [Candidatus Woesearchaeota archaeon]|nr:hypothetical protein [Candidatus Woesearchaeota archaeon]